MPVTANNKNYLKAITITALGFFLLNATGALLAWHIQLAGGHHHHDSDHCPVCQNIDANASKAAIPAQTSPTIITEHIGQFKYIYTLPRSIKIPLQISPRAPPA